MKGQARTSATSKPEQLAEVMTKIRALQERGFYGHVTLDIAGGNILRLLKNESELIGGPDGESKEEARAHGRANQETAAEA